MEAVPQAERHFTVFRRNIRIAWWPLFWVSFPKDNVVTLVLEAMKQLHEDEKYGPEVIRWIMRELEKKHLSGDPNVQLANNSDEALEYVSC